MPKSFVQITNESGGVHLFSCNQSDVLVFLAGPLLHGWGGMCLALVMMWLNQDTCKEAPNKGIVNKTTANNLQQEMEGSWEGLKTAVKWAKKFLASKTFWWNSTDMHKFDTLSAPAPFLQNDPKYKRDGLHILVLYFNEGPAHATGAATARKSSLRRW